MRIYVDATRPVAAWTLWGMTLVERLLRQLARAGASHAQVHLAPGVALSDQLRPDFRGRLRLEAVTAAPADDGELTLTLDATAVYDTRVVEHLLAARGPLELRGTAAARVVGGSGAAHSLELEALPSYLPTLRRHRAPFVLAIRDRVDLRAAERITFEAVYKGVTDVVTKYVYPYPVRWIVRALAPTSITPNQVTAVSMVLSFGAIPLFATGHLAIAIVMGLVMSVLDSVDGKLARLTFRESRTGNWMDHGSDFVYFGLWLAAVAVVAGDGAARWVLPAAWLLDKMVVGLFKVVRGRELNDWAPIDAAFRLIVIRRNVFLVVLAIGVIAGRADVAVALLAAWAVIGALFHTLRWLWIAVNDEPPRASRLHGQAAASTTGQATGGRR